MYSGYKKQYGIRITVYAPTTPFESPERIFMPEDHPCHGCPIIDLNNVKPYCFLPGCLRHEFVRQQMGDESL